MGIDKIANTKHLSFGITSRIIQGKSGKERITATIGQTKYYEDQKVGLPGETLNKKGDSDRSESPFLLRVSPGRPTF